MLIFQPVTFKQPYKTIVIIVAWYIYTLLNNGYSEAIAQTSMQKEWQKMHESKKDALKSFQDARFGMFIHWGLYAIPGGIWKGKKMEEMGVPNVAEWVQLVAKIPRKEYAELAGQFNPVNFNADAIASLAKNAGMKYIVITAKHHEGFAMYHSKVSPFNIVDATPYNRDVLADLYKACKKYGLDFGIYYSHNIDWADGADAQYQETKLLNDKKGAVTDPFGANLWDPSQNTFQAYLDKKAIPQVEELLTSFPDLKCIWFDMPGLMKPGQSFQFYKTVYKKQPNTIINQRIGNQLGDYDIPGDNKIPEQQEKFDLPWETVGTLNNSWGYKSYDNDWKSPQELLYWLLEITSKGGNYMLNIGPAADGSVPVQAARNLEELGKWMKINGEAVYGTQRWKITHEGPASLNIGSTEQRQTEGFKLNISSEDIWFTCRNSTIYAIAMKSPSDGKIKVKSLNQGSGKIKQVELLGYGILKFEQRADALYLDIPTPADRSQGYVLKTTFK
ncbi:alpha-L-fucosidase [Desertivirga arenae]|uniref:alpha-L-fucosidase n=1 Tax=Desertivirga arenae TaxID=2810309 RepID=UPI001A9691F4|nr:alpha-L-fucosidase [Pedobacter sp. SYSU D00823]